MALKSLRQLSGIALVVAATFAGLAGDRPFRIDALAAAENSAAFDAVKRLGRGINILGYDGIWDGGIDAPFKFQNFRRIRRAGFQHVRINFHAFKYMNAEGRVDPVVLAALDDVLAAAVSASLIPIIDEHNSDECEQAIQECHRLLGAFWTQITARYLGKYPTAIFELLNEPGGHMDHAAWNDLALALLKTIRVTDRERMVVIAALNSEEPEQLRALDLPQDDRNIILTVHYYKPFNFTHQGAPWIPNGPPAGIAWGSRAEKAALAQDIGAIKRWADAQQRPVYLGEFGVYDAAKVKDRAAYMSAVARAAEQSGWAWAAWQFDHDFSIFNTDIDDWNAALLRALIPN